MSHIFVHITFLIDPRHPKILYDDIVEIGNSSTEFTEFME